MQYFSKCLKKTEEILVYADIEVKLFSLHSKKKN